MQLRQNCLGESARLDRPDYVEAGEDTQADVANEANLSVDWRKSPSTAPRTPPLGPQP